MTGACLLLGATVLQLATPDFTLSWTHSVEHVEWRETWSIADQHLILLSSAVKGSGAGMEPGPEARLLEGWWVSPGGLQVPSLTLATSGATEGGWSICSGGTCQAFGASAHEPLTIAPCGAGAVLRPGGDEAPAKQAHSAQRAKDVLISLMGSSG